MVLAQDSRRPTSEGWLPSMDRCVGAAVLEPTRTRARRTGGRGIVRGWGDAIQAGLNHAAPAGSSTGIAARSGPGLRRSLPGHREADLSAMDSVGPFSSLLAA
jgi:hypothetical protein